MTGGQAERRQNTHPVPVRSAAAGENIRRKYIKGTGVDVEPLRGHPTLGVVPLPDSQTFPS